MYGGGSVRAWRARMVAATGGTVAVPRGGTWGMIPQRLATNRGPYCGGRGCATPARSAETTKGGVFDF